MMTCKQSSHAGATNSNKQTKRQSERNAELNDRNSHDRNRTLPNERTPAFYSRGSFSLVASASSASILAASLAGSTGSSATARSFAVGATAVATGTPPGT